MKLLEEKIDLFLKEASPGARRHSLTPALVDFFTGAHGAGRHVICKSAVLYLFEGDRLVQAIPADGGVGRDELVFTFDGKTISRIHAAYYLGTEDDHALGGVSVGYVYSQTGNTNSNNNNNNNNNNNGNNNG